MPEGRQVVRINGEKVNLLVRKQYTQNGFRYGYVFYKGEDLEVCRDTTIKQANGIVTYEWSVVRG